MKDNFKASCVECGRVFDLLNEKDLEEVRYWHDCEVPSTRNESYWFDHADGRFI